MIVQIIRNELVLCCLFAKSRLHNHTGLFGTNSHQHCNNYLTHTMNSPKPHPLLSLHSCFTSNLKHCSSTNPILICPLLPTSLPVSTPNTIHHSRLTVCLPA